MIDSRSGAKSASAFRTISEASELLDVPQHVLRFWETKFSLLKPMKRGGRRYYRPEDLKLLSHIKALLYEEGYTIKGAQRHLRENRGSKVGEDAAQSSSKVLDGSGDPLQRSESGEPPGNLGALLDDLREMQEILKKASN